MQLQSHMFQHGAVTVIHLMLPAFCCNNNDNTGSQILLLDFSHSACIFSCYKKQWEISVVLQAHESYSVFFSYNAF